MLTYLSDFVKLQKTQITDLDRLMPCIHLDRVISFSGTHINRQVIEARVTSELWSRFQSKETCCLLLTVYPSEF